MCSHNVKMGIVLGAPIRQQPSLQNIHDSRVYAAIPKFVLLYNSNKNNRLGIRYPGAGGMPPLFQRCYRTDCFDRGMP